MFPPSARPSVVENKGTLERIPIEKVGLKARALCIGASIAVNVRLYQAGVERNVGNPTA
jgi:hypothetical protein